MASTTHRTQNVDNSVHIKQDVDAIQRLIKNSNETIIDMKTIYNTYCKDIVTGDLIEINGITVRGNLCVGPFC